MPQQRTLSPGYAVVFPNREKAGSKAMKALVALILLVSVGLILIVTIGGWSELEGMKPLNFFWCIAYLIIAFYVFVRWSRGMLPIAAGLGILLLMIAPWWPGSDCRGRARSIGATQGSRRPIRCLEARG